jgi:uncharacterized protein GlcG (DUF336 family)
MGNVRRSSCALSFAITIALGLAACSGSSNSGDPAGTAPPPASTADSGCTGSCVNASSFLSSADVQRVIAQGVAEAAARQRPGVIAVVDRVGNVLGVYRMTGTPTTVRITSGRGVNGGLENLDVPTELAAIAKAITGAYLSSEGNAFSTRTASQIVQEHFNPGEFNAPAGPLFGVQFSQLPCSDLNTRFATGLGTGPGPNRSPLGLSADPGGFPLYKDGVPIGGVGFAGGDGIYGLDPVIGDRDLDIDELVATAATFGFAAPLDRRGDRITADGKTFRFSDVDFTDLSSTPGSLANLASGGAFAAVPSYFDGTVRAGTVFGSAASGIRPDTTLYPNRDAYVLVDRTGAERYAPRAGTSGSGAISAEEARVIVDEALGVVNRARAQIRRPLSTPARVSISVVDANGVVLALARTRDAPVFGLDVALQKARTASFFSGNFAAPELLGRIPTQYFSVALQPNAQAPTTAAITVAGNASIADYVTRLRDFLGRPTALADGSIAFSDRAIGNLARPYYPDGIVSPQAGPLSRPFAQWSPFHDGLQLDLAYTALAFSVVHYLDRLGLALTLNGSPLPSPFPDPPQGTCTGIPRLGNGIQIFPGGMPIYRGNQLVGAIGISGDGIDQDDMTAFLGLHNAAARLTGSNLGNAPREIRADQLVPDNARLRYVQCPQAPFIGSDEQNVCEGK